MIRAGSKSQKIHSVYTLRQLRKHQVLSVHQLMEMFDCAHMTLHRVIALLEQEGLVYR
jgi:DNA-binding GntR family transcriptional regulator